MIDYKHYKAKTVITAAYLLIEFRRYIIAAVICILLGINWGDILWNG